MTLLKKIYQQIKMISSIRLFENPLLATGDLTIIPEPTGVSRSDIPVATPGFAL